MADESNEQAVMVASPPADRHGPGHVEQLRAILAKMPRPGAPVEESPAALPSPAEDVVDAAGATDDGATDDLVAEHVPNDDVVADDASDDDLTRDVSTVDTGTRARPPAPEPIRWVPVGTPPRPATASVPDAEATLAPLVAATPAPVAVEPPPATADVAPVGRSLPVPPPPWEQPVSVVPQAAPPAPRADLAGPGVAVTVTHRKRHGLRRALIVLLALALVAGAAGGGVFAWRKLHKAPVAWDSRVVGIVHFVEHERGLTFKHPVPVQFLSDARFETAVRVPQPGTGHARTEMRQALQELRALGLVSGNVNLATSLDTLQKSDVIGLYVPEKKTVYVRGQALTPFVRVTLAHELTHALQDQYFDLAKIEAAQGAVDGSAVTALVEGDATRVENAYEQSLSSADQASYQQGQQQAQQRAGQASQVPAVLSDLMDFPYAFGPTYVDALVAQSGVGALNSAFRDPPRSQAQILDPAAYPVSWHPVPVARPVLPAGSHVLDTASPFGQAMLFELLGSRLGYQQSWSAVQGWQGDNSVPYSVGGHTCVAVDVRMADGAHAAALSAAGSAWTAASGIPGATVTQAGTLVSLRSCDPGPSIAAPPAATPSAFDILAARAALIDGVLSSGPVDFPMSRCIADDVIGSLGPAGYGELTADTLSAGQQQVLVQLAGSAARQCQAQGVR